MALDHHCLTLGEDLGDHGPISHLVVEFKLDRPVNLTIVDGQDIEAWLLGILDRRPTVVENDGGQRCLRLHFRPLAVLRGPEC